MLHGFKPAKVWRENSTSLIQENLFPACHAMSELILEDPRN